MPDLTERLREVIDGMTSSKWASLENVDDEENKGHIGIFTGTLGEAWNIARVWGTGPNPYKDARAICLLRNCAEEILELREASEELIPWPIEFDDMRLNHISVQIDRISAKRLREALIALDAALERELEKTE